MKNHFKIILGIVGVIILLFIVDLICIFTINRPLFAIKNDGGNVYRGLFYDTYNCSEYTVPQIKAKKTKFTCSDIKVNIDKVVSIKDTSKDIKDFACDNFHEDNNYTHY